MINLYDVNLFLVLEHIFFMSYAYLELVSVFLPLHWTVSPETVDSISFEIY